jgi:hypothetical protein
MTGCDLETSDVCRVILLVHMEDGVQRSLELAILFSTFGDFHDSTGVRHERWMDTIWFKGLCTRVIRFAPIP